MKTTPPCSDTMENSLRPQLAQWCSKGDNCLEVKCKARPMWPKPQGSLTNPMPSMGLVYLPTFGWFFWYMYIGKYAIHGCYGNGRDFFEQVSWELILQSYFFGGEKWKGLLDFENWNHFFVFFPHRFCTPALPSAWSGIPQGPRQNILKIPQNKAKVLITLVKIGQLN